MSEIARELMNLPDGDGDAASELQTRIANVVRPSGALDRLDRAAIWLAEWQRTSRPSVDAPAALIFAADHGVATAGVSAYPASVTRAMVEALRDGVATASVMAEAVGASLDVIDLGVGVPTGDIRTEPALDLDRFHECFREGREAVKRLDGADLLVVGEMGIGNTTAAAAVCCGLFGGPAAQWTGRGTGVDDERLAVKVRSVDTAVRRLGRVDPLEVLRQLGGAELVGMAGAVFEARFSRLPVVLDGFVASAAAAALERLRPGALQHTVAGHRSAELGHRLLLQELDKEPLLDLGLRLGEASGALAAVPILRLAAVCATRVATFQDRGIAG